MIRHVVFLLLMAILPMSCEEEESESCNVNTLAVAASLTVDGEEMCLSNGGLGYFPEDNLLLLRLWHHSPVKIIDVLFTADNQGLQFDQALPVYSGKYNEQHQVTSGSITLTKDNYPTDPSLLQYGGVFDLVFSEGAGDISVAGDFSFEKGL